MSFVEVRRSEIPVGERPAFSFGMFLPREIPNSEVETWGLSDLKGRPITAEATFLRSGIERRFQADPSKTPYDLGYEAAKKVIKPRQSFDSVIVSSSYPAGFNQADKLVEDFRIRTNNTLELGGACDGFAAMLGQFYLYPEFYGDNILFETNETYSKYCANLRELGIEADPSQAELLFGDIGLATIINRKKLELGKPVHVYKPSDDILLPYQEERPGNYWRMRIPESSDYFRQNGPNVIQTIREVLPDLIKEAISQSDYDPSEIAYVVTHQPTFQALKAISDRVPHLNFVNDVRDGNYSSASIPKALKSLIEGNTSYILRDGKEITGKFQLVHEQPFVIAGFGAGFYATAMVAVMHK